MTIGALRSGDEAAFRSLVEEHHGAMVALASQYVPSRAVAEEVAQETWMAVIQGIGRFEGRSSLKTWIFSILLNQARTRGVRERHTATPGPAALGTDGIDDDRFCGPEDRWAGHWADPVARWSDTPAERLVGEETLDVVRAAIATLPEGQRQVVTLRDVEGWTAVEVREALGLTEGNQRVLLHRARLRIRSALEGYVGGLRTR